ncbi:MAG: hypothetical protein M1831_003950 [Alyxoria varia]|nr:MAG: hypothetical protein M1831_003950 [Alyxoria varia]
MPPRARLVRRTPLATRLKAYLDPLDFLLWASEELNSRDWEDFQAQWATSIGIALNISFMIARANSTNTSSSYGEAVFSDDGTSTGCGWLSWLATFTAHALALLSLTNAFYTFFRKRHYRLFESSIDATPNTPSAQRVRVDSSPLSSSPLRYLSSVLAVPTAESRTHPDSTRDVWELNVWDPNPLCLRVFCLFSPLHVLIYWMFLPLAPLDPRPSITVFTVAFMTSMLSIQMRMFQSFFTQQAKDTMIIHKEVQNEYDTKFVRPTIHKPVRDVSTQTSTPGTPGPQREVLAFTPTTFVNRGFHPKPNANYSQHYDPDGKGEAALPYERSQRAVSTPDFRSPVSQQPADFSSPLRRMPSNVSRQPSRNESRMSGAGSGGNLGVYSHAHSPLKQGRSENQRQGSPLKRITTPGGEDLGVSRDPQRRINQLKGEGMKRQSRSSFG